MSNKTYASDFCDVCGRMKAQISYEPFPKCINEDCEKGYPVDKPKEKKDERKT